MTATHKETTAVHPLSAAVDTARTHYEISAPQAVDPVSVGTPSQPQQPAIGLPSTGLFHPGQESTGLRGAVGGSNGGIDPSKTGSNAETSLDDMASAIGALRSSMLDALDPNKDHDPSKAGSQDDLTGGSLSQELKAALGSYFSSNPTGETGGASGKGGSREDSMVGAVTESNETKFGNHHVEDCKSTIDTDKGTAVKDCKTFDNGEKTETKTTVDLNHHTTTVVHQDGTYTVTDNRSGHVVKREDVPLQPLTIPDEDHQPASDPSLTREAKAAAVHEHLASHGGGNTNVVDTDIPGTVSSADIRSVVTGGKESLIANPGSADAEGGHMGGGPAPRSTGGDAINDLNATTQGTGPEQHNQPGVKTGPIAPADPAHQGHGSEQTGGDSHPVSRAETAVQHAAQELRDAVGSTHPDETTKTAQSVGANHDNGNSGATNAPGGGTDARGSDGSGDTAVDSGGSDQKGVSHQVSLIPGETAAQQHAAQGLQSAVDDRYDRGAGLSSGPLNTLTGSAHPPASTGDNVSHQVSLIAKPVETAAQQHAAQELQDAVDSHLPVKPALTEANHVAGVHTAHDVASVLGSTLGSGPVGDNGAFADLIRLAHNPTESGLVPPLVSVGHDPIAALQLSALGDLAAHAGDAHHVDDVHAAATIALPAAVHEDVSHLNAAAIDHAHAAH